MNKKVLILTMTCGEGHNAIAKSIANELTKNNTDCKIVDVFESKPKLKKFYNDSYLFLCKHFPKTYQFFWQKQRKHTPENLNKSNQIKQILPVADHIDSIIKEYQPTTIVSVHNVAGAVISYLKVNGRLEKNIKSITVMFDYVLCPYWDTNKYNDYCITPNEFCHNDLLKLGFKEEQLVCLGFPVNSKFYNKLDKTEIRKKLGLKNIFTFFSIAGGNGLGNSLKLLKNILKTKGEYQVIIVCGKNKKSKQQIEKYIAKHKISNVMCLGFVDNINELMCASDVAFARGGGAGISECFYSNLPIIFRKGLIINERENKDIFVKNGCGFEIRHDKDIEKICQNLIDNQDIITKMQQNIVKFKKDRPIEAIAKFIIK